MSLPNSVQILFFLCLIWSGFWYIGSALTGLFLIIGSVAFYSNRIKKPFQFYSLTGLMTAYLFWLFVVAYSSLIPNTSMMMLPVYAGLPVTYLIATNLENFKAVWEKLRITFFLIGIIFSIWAIWQVVYKIGYGYATGPLLDRNAFAALTNLLWFPAIYLFVKSRSMQNKGHISLLYGLSLFLMSVALFATTSRGGIAVWLLLTPVLLLASYKYAKSKSVILNICLIAIMAYAVSATLLKSDIADRNFNIGVSTQSGMLSQDASANARILMWQSTLRMAVDHPITGTGWGTFVSIYPKYRSPLENSTSGVTAHNDYLQIASEGGFVAMFLLISIFTILVVQLIKSLKLANKENGFESVVILLGVMAVFIHAIINFIFVFSFINLLLALYLARVAQIIEQPKALKIRELQIRSCIKTTGLSLIALFLAIPFLFHVSSQALLTGSRPGLKLVNLLNPHISAYQVASFITAIYPQEYIAQQMMLQTAEEYLKLNRHNPNVTDAFKKNVLSDMIERFDAALLRSAHNPALGVREAKVLIDYSNMFAEDYAVVKAEQILTRNLQVDPTHVNSMITLSRLRVLQGNLKEASAILDYASTHIRTRRDQQLVIVEKLRIKALPKVLNELNTIEVELKSVLSEYETGKPHLLPVKFYEDIDSKLREIEQKIDSDIN